MKKVSKDEYEAFLKSYGKPLMVDVCGISDPPSVNHYDKETKKLVAHTFAYSDKPGDFYYEPEEERYYSISDG